MAIVIENSLIGFRKIEKLHTRNAVWNAIGKLEPIGKLEVRCLLDSQPMPDLAERL